VRIYTKYVKVTANNTLCKQPPRGKTVLQKVSGIEAAHACFKKEVISAPYWHNPNVSEENSHGHNSLSRVLVDLTNPILKFEPENFQI
jgi:hypothetical protein